MSLSSYVYWKYRYTSSKSSHDSSKLDYFSVFSYYATSDNVDSRNKLSSGLRSFIINTAHMHCNIDTLGDRDFSSKLIVLI